MDATQVGKQRIESLATYIPIDRRQAMIEGKDLADRTSGSVLFVDISGFTPLTEMLMKQFGHRRGAEELTRQLDTVYGALITRVHCYRGSVIGFSGDGITCWFDGDDGLQAVACALSMHQVMDRFAEVEIRSGVSWPLTIKVAVATGPARRFLVGDPQIQLIDVVAGVALERVAAAEKQTHRGEVVITSETATQMGDKVTVLEWRNVVETGERFAVVARLMCQVETTPWRIPLPSAYETEREVTGRVETLAEEQVKRWLLPPVYEKLRTGQGPFLAELRPAVALFLKFGILDYDQDDAASEKLNAYIHWVQSVLAHYEGYLIPFVA